MTLLFLIILAFALGFYIARQSISGTRTSFQNDGEARLSKVLQSNFCSPDYHLMNHVTLKLNDGTTQIDHILVSRFGVFVIETKDYSGWIFANAKSPNWTQVLFRMRFSFQNPIRQNYRHLIAVRKTLDFLPPDSIKSAVVFTGNAEFKTEIPSGVFDLHDFIDYLSNQNQELLSLNRLQFCVGRLETLRLAISGDTDIDHIRNLQRKHGGEP